MKTISPIILLVSLLMCGCSSISTHERPVEYVVSYKELPNCPRPNRPVLDKVNSNEHIGSINNVSAYDDIVMTLINYVYQLESTIDCYEARKKSCSEASDERKDSNSK